MRGLIASYVHIVKKRYFIEFFLLKISNKENEILKKSIIIILCFVIVIYVIISFTVRI